MKGIDLINLIKEKNLENLEVVFVQDNESFILKSIDEIDEIETENKEKFIGLFCGVEYPDLNNN